jgi:hypothetical protein
LSTSDEKAKARAKLTELFVKPKNSYVIHYACTDFNKEPIRIISIAIRSLDQNAQTYSFPSINNISQTYNEEYEKQLLKKFYDHIFHDHIKYNKNVKYIHWNGRDENFGIQNIESRFKELLPDIEIPFIKHENMYDLAKSLAEIYGKNYVVEHPRMENIMVKNGFNTDNNDFLKAGEELKAFENNEFNKIRNSVKRKVQNLSDIVKKANSGTLKTDVEPVHNSEKSEIEVPSHTDKLKTNNKKSIFALIIRPVLWIIKKISFNVNI